ncbi:MAG: hypothetical protein A4E49_00229 [Methanosaeta sp. PtaU1.Bin112]|nr:MAG: hypothetical protein A4E49_00229 [Methanosaeta sp. PtaU1.Bin112]
MDGAHLCIPKEEKIGLVMKKGDWLTGYGHSEYLFTDIMLFWPGDYISFVARSPGVYDFARVFYTSTLARNYLQRRSRRLSGRRPAG